MISPEESLAHDIDVFDVVISLASPSIDSEVRNRLALALDFPDLDEAVRLARRLTPWFGVAKVGLELYSAAGPEAIERLRALDLAVFADLKLHDIPNTVERAAACARRSRRHLLELPHLGWCRDVAGRTRRTRTRARQPRDTYLRSDSESPC